MTGHDIVVNGTSLGLKEGDPTPLDVSRLEQSMIVGEVIMQLEMTPLLVAARAAGCRIHLGRTMLEVQVALMVEYMGVE